MTAPDDIDAMIAKAQARGTLPVPTIEQAEDLALAFTEDILNRNGRPKKGLDARAVQELTLFARQSERALTGRDWVTAYDVLVWLIREHGEPGEQTSNDAAVTPREEYDRADGAQVIASLCEDKDYQTSQVRAGNLAATFDVWIGTQRFRVAVTGGPGF